MADSTSGGRRRGPTREVLPHARPGPNEAVEREISHHIEERVERLIEEGLSPEEARVEAERRFGDVDRIREEVRTVDRRVAAWPRFVAFIDKTACDLRYGVRSALRSPGLSLTIVVTLALGIGANTAIFSLVEAVLLRPLPFHEPERLADVSEVTPRGQFYAVAPANFLDWQERQEVFEAMAVIASGVALVTEGGPAERVTGVRVSARYFQVLGVEPASGRAFTDEEDVPGGPDVVVVSHAFWVSRLGRDPDVIGRSIRLDGNPHTVIGVMPERVRAFQAFYSLDPIMLWRPNPFLNDPPEERRAKRLTVLARLKDGATMESARAEMEALAVGLAREHPETNEGWSVAVAPLQAISTAAARTPLLVLLGAVGFILLIACLNVASLLLARADVRRSAVTVRRALGATRSDIVRQLLAESLVLSLGAGLLGIALAWSLLPVLVASSPVNLTRSGDVSINGAVLLFTVIAAVVTAVVTGLAPALGVSSSNLSQEIKDRGLGKTENRRARRSRSTLVVVEVALSVVLVIGAGLMLGSYVRLTGLELGFEPEGVVRVGALLPRATYATAAGRGSHPATENFTLWRPRPEETEFMEGVEAALARLPGVESVAAGNFDPLPGLMWASIARPEGEPPASPDEQGRLAFRPVSPGWFETIRMPIVAGRPLTEADRFATEDVVVLDEGAVALLWPGGRAADALGRRVMLQDGIEDVERPHHVVGVSAATRQAILDNTGQQVYEGPMGVAHVPYRRQAEAYVDWQIAFRLRSVFLVRTSRELADIAPEIRAVVEAFDPELPITIERLEDAIAGPLSSRRFYMAMLVAFGSVALLLAASGVFAVMAYTVTRKTRELGIRLALGARGAELERAELMRGAKLAIIGLVIGGIGAAWLARFIAAFLYGVGTVDPATYGAVALLVVFIVLAASYVPARRAAMVDPMDSLRTE